MVTHIGCAAKRGVTNCQFSPQLKCARCASVSILLTNASVVSRTSGALARSIAKRSTRTDARAEQKQRGERMPVERALSDQDNDN